MSTRREGHTKETEAARWLEEQGYTILESNYHCKFGEIDLIAGKESTIVFIEVKYRKSSFSGYAEEAVPFSKQRKICRTADYFRMTYGLSEAYSFRFDVIAITAGRLKHFENAFPYTGRG